MPLPQLRQRSSPERPLQRPRCPGRQGCTVRGEPGRAAPPAARPERLTCRTGGAGTSGGREAATPGRAAPAPARPGPPPGPASVPGLAVPEGRRTRLGPRGGSGGCPRPGRRPSLPWWCPAQGPGRRLLLRLRRLLPMPGARRRRAAGPVSPGSPPAPVYRGSPGRAACQRAAPPRPAPAAMARSSTGRRGGRCSAGRGCRGARSPPAGAFPAGAFPARSPPAGAFPAGALGHARMRGAPSRLRTSHRERSCHLRGVGGGGGTRTHRGATLGSGASGVRLSRAQPSALPPPAAGGDAALTIAQGKTARVLVRRIKHLTS